MKKSTKYIIGGAAAVGVVGLVAYFATRDDKKLGGGSSTMSFKPNGSPTLTTPQSNPTPPAPAPQPSPVNQLPPSPPTLAPQDSQQVAQQLSQLFQDFGSGYMGQGYNW